MSLQHETLEQSNNTTTTLNGSPIWTIAATAGAAAARVSGSVALRMLLERGPVGCHATRASLSSRASPAFISTIISIVMFNTFTDC